MKQYYTLILVVFLGFIVGSCRQNNNSEREELLQAERDSLLQVANANQEELEKMTSFFDDVSACIDSIAIQEALLIPEVYKETNNKKVNSKDLTDKLNLLAEVIIGQKERIAHLVDSLNNRVDTTRIAGLRKTIEFLTNQLTQKENQISMLKAELSSEQKNVRNLTSRVNQLTSTVGKLEEQNSNLTDAVKYQSEVINEGYVLVADKNQLKDMGIVEGGFLKKSKTNLGNINLSKCSKVNISIFTELPIKAKSVKILSPVPAGSYSIKSSGDSQVIKVTDPNAFWSLSNILVIQKN